MCNYETATDAFQLSVKLHQQSDTSGAEKRDLGKIQKNAVRAFPDDFLQVAPQVFGPIVIKATLHLDFECISELLGDDFHVAAATGGSSPSIPMEWRYPVARRCCG